MRWMLPAMLLTVTTIAEAAPDTWSKPVEGIRARLVTTSKVDAKTKQPQLEVWLEIENVSDTDGGIPIAWGYVGDMLKLTVEDDKGKEVGGAGVGGSWASGPPYVVALPVEATLRVPISKNAFEYVQSGKIYFRPLTFQAWDLPAKHPKWTLRGQLTPHKGVKVGDRAWTKAIDLPKIEIP